jgi:hypothetical protein
MGSLWQDGLGPVAWLLNYEESIDPPPSTRGATDL